MITLGLYLIKVCVCLVILYLPYVILFRKNTFFQANRLYLLSALISSFIIPVIEIPQGNAIHSVIELSSSKTSLNQYYDDFASAESFDSNSINYSMILSVLYFSGVLIFAGRLILSVRTILKIKRNSEVIKIDDTNIVRIDSDEPFSFFNFIFLPNDKINPLIIQHEKVHVSQCHWIDLLLIEAATIVLWFNPIILLFKRSLKLQHEYLADENAIRGDVQTEDYLHCLLKEVQRTHLYGPISNFYFQFIKNRITMITKKRTPLPFLALYFILIPTIFLLSFSFSKGPINTFKSPDVAIRVSENGIPAIAPVDLNKAKISSGYGMRRHPMLGDVRLHTGIDFQLAEGEIVKSTADGIVVENTKDNYRGQFLLIQHGKTFSSSYSHLKSAIVKVGDHVQSGQTIGYVGNTGLSSDYHLHYEVLKDGKAVDPKEYLPKMD